MPPKPRLRAPKPVRYWPGKGQEQEIQDESSDEEAIGAETDAAVSGGGEAIRSVTEVQIRVAGDDGSDRRLRRLQRRNEVDGGDDPGENEDEAAFALRRRQRNGRGIAATGAVQPQTLVNDDNEYSKKGVEDEDNAAELRRTRVREAALRRALVAADADLNVSSMVEKEESEDSNSGSGSDSDSDSDSVDDKESRRTLLKPVFIPKSHRETIHERERIEKEAEEAEQKRLQELESRKQESHNLVEEELRKEIAAATVNDTIPDVDDTDGLDEEDEYEAWKLRELMRIKRDREERDAEENELAEIERRRNMTDAEILAEDEKLNGGKEEKKSYKFMQKYYHKGAFFNDEEILQNRDFNEPTLEDKFDKSILPAVMQVKNFGRSGQTKWTHLSKEDTSSKDSAWFQNSDVNKRTLSKLGGFKQGYDKPTARKRSKLE